MKPYEPERLYRSYRCHYHTTVFPDLPELPQTLYIEACTERIAKRQAIATLNRVFGKGNYHIDRLELLPHEFEQ